MAAASSLPVAQSLQSLLGPLVKGAPAGLVSGLTLDSRRVKPGEAFFAIQGKQTHGAAYALAAIDAGAAAIVYTAGEVDDLQLQKWRLRGVMTVAVPQLPVRLGEIAARFYAHPSQALQIAAITGTDGKTSVAHLLAQAWQQLQIMGAYGGTLGWGLPTDSASLAPASLTTPDAICLQAELFELRRQAVTHLAMEVSSHALDQHRIDGVAVDFAVLTNLGHDHLDYHTSLARYWAAKRRLFGFPNAQAVLNIDDAHGAQLATEIAAVTYGFAAHAHISASEFSVTRSGLHFKLRKAHRNAMINSSLFGQFNVSNLLAVAAVLLASGVDFDEVRYVLERLSAVPGRMEVVRSAQFQVVVDYAHTPQALYAALQAVRAHGCKRLWCVFGCGGDRDVAKRPLMARAAEQLADRIVVTSDNPRGEAQVDISQDILGGVKDPASATVIDDRREAIAFALKQAAVGDSILIAGKGHEPYQLIGDRRICFDDRQVVREILEASAHV